MKVNFFYSRKKDIENIFKATDAVNSKEKTDFQKKYYAMYDELRIDNINKFIDKIDYERDVNIEEARESIATKWLQVSDEFEKRMNKYFGIIYPSRQIIAYLTHDQRCTYNISGEYFFITINARSPELIIMHELFHFYTWHAFGKRFSKSLSAQQYNDIKESLTELLNLICGDLFQGALDKGYPQHQEMRALVKEMYNKGLSVENIANELKSMV